MPLVKKRNVPGAPKKWAWNYRKPSKCKTRCLQAGVFLSLGKTGMLHGCKARNFNWLRCFSAINSRLKYTYRMKIKPKIWKTFRRYFFWLVFRVGVSKKNKLGGADFMNVYQAYSKRWSTRNLWERTTGVRFWTGAKRSICCGSFNQKR